MSGRSLGGQVAWSAVLTLEFLDQAGSAVSPATREMAWGRPRFLLQALQSPIPAFLSRPGFQPLHPGQWYPIEIRPM
jgi:hypothetical protein